MEIAYNYYNGNYDFDSTGVAFQYFDLFQNRPKRIIPGHPDTISLQ